MKRVSWYVAIFAWFLLPAMMAAQTTLRLSPMIVRQAAINAPLPIYPKASIKSHHQGVAVAEVLLDAQGTPEAVTVLQAPDQATSDSVSSALKSWRIKPYKSSSKDGVVIRTRLIFYFKLDSSAPVVIDAQQSRL
jgi:TonB family protein